MVFLLFMNPVLSTGDLVLEGGDWEVEGIDHSVLVWNRII